MNKLKYILFAFAAFSMTLVASCSSDDSVADGGRREVMNEGAPAELTVKLATMSADMTRTLSEANENIINDLALLAFNDRGNCNGFSYTRVARAGYGYTLNTGRVPTRQGDNITIYAVANVDGTSCDSAVLSKIETIEEFKKCAIVLSSTDDIVNDDDTPMFGYVTGYTLAASTGAVNIDLTRLATKMNFTIQVDSGVALAGLQLCHVPMASYLYQDKNYVKGNSYLSNPGTVYANQPMINCGKVENDDPIHTLDTLVTFYMFENLVGQSEASAEESLRTFENAPVNATYLNVTTNIGGASYTFRVYLGGVTFDDYTNYDIPRNYAYTGKIRIAYSASKNTAVIMPVLVTRNNTIDNWTAEKDSTSMYN
jgi:hypothetical protein